jgi:hypothetical protein
MNFLMKQGWTVAAVVLVSGASLQLGRGPVNFVPGIMLICFAYQLWKRERSRARDWAAKKIIMMSASVLTVDVMKVKPVEELMQTHVGISGYGAALLLVAPLVIGFVWVDIKMKLAEEQAKNPTGGKGLE